MAMMSDSKRRTSSDSGLGSERVGESGKRREMTESRSAGLARAGGEVASAVVEGVDEREDGSVQRALR
nr:hypothetical protein CFP56_32959 [Quercus suber]